MAVFDHQKHEQYAQEAKERWGTTEAYREYEGKHKENPGRDALEGMEAIFGEFARLMRDKTTPASNEAQEAVKALQAHITENFYTCTKEILAGLGQMYAADERFRAGIDRYGAGTAEFVSAAIREYCK